jgi:hypothetical protein
MSDDVVRRYNGARSMQAPTKLLADAIREVETLREENARLREALEGWQKWWTLPWQDRRPDMADLCWKRSRDAIRKGGKDEN